MAQKYNLTGQKVGKLLIGELVPVEKRPTKNHGNYWYCKCDCGNEVMVPTSYLSGNGNYTQMSCGCDRKKKAFLKTSNVNTTQKFTDTFDDFEKYLFIHKQITANGKRNYEYQQSQYEEDIKYFYNDIQFNAVYKFWKNNANRGNTFYDLAKPSLDHIIPKSRGGQDIRENYQFLTVFENLSKRDMTWEEWCEFKEKTHTSSDYFIENILKL